MENQSHPLQVPKIWMPTSLEAATSIKKQFGHHSTYVAGATLLQLRWQSAQTMPQHHINLEKISALQQYNFEENSLIIGALTKLSALRFDPALKNRYPAISEAIKSIAAPAVRNRGTVGGNVMGGEGDLIPLLLAMKAEMTFLQEDRFKTISMADWVENRHAQDDLLVKIAIPAPSPVNSYTFYKKIGRRETFTAAIVTVSGQISWSESQAVTEVCLTIGGGSNKPGRLVKAEQYITGKKIEQIDWTVVYREILDDYCPATDAFVTSNYKRKVAANLIISELQHLLNTQVEREVPVYEM